MSKGRHMGSGNAVAVQVVEKYENYGVIITGLNNRAILRTGDYAYIVWTAKGMDGLKSCKVNDVFCIEAYLIDYNVTYSEYYMRYYCEDLKRCIYQYEHKYPPHMKPQRKVLPLPNYSAQTTTPIPGSKGYIVKNEALGMLSALNMDSIIPQIKSISTGLVGVQLFIPECNQSKLLELAIMINPTYPAFVSQHLIPHTFN